MVCLVLFQCQISYSKLTACKSIDLSRKRKMFEIIRCSYSYVHPIHDYHADLFYDRLPLMLEMNKGVSQ